MTTTAPFPFTVSSTGSVSPAGADDAALNAKIVQILFTTPGERVNEPEFGCGISNLVFDADTAVLAAAMEFTAGQALTRWLADDIVVDGVDVADAGPDGALTVSVVYTRRRDAARQTVRITFR